MLRNTGKSLASLALDELIDCLALTVERRADELPDAAYQDGKCYAYKHAINLVQAIVFDEQEREGAK